MTDRKRTDQSTPNPKDRPKTERPPETARTPKGDNSWAKTDAGRERATEQGERGFNPNVNQRPR